MPPLNRFLTKSRFKLATECPRKLYYVDKVKGYRNSMEGNDFLAMLAEGGYQVGALAKLRYPEGIEILGLDPVAAEEQTRRHLAQDRVVLFEPAIRVGNFFIRIDILVKNGNRFELIEVKAKSYNSLEPEIAAKRGGISSGMLPYIQDAAFQSWVLQQAIPSADICTFLMMPDKSKLAPVDGINQMFRIGAKNAVETSIPNRLDAKVLAETLLAKVPVDEYVSHVLNTPLSYPGGEGQLAELATTWAEAYRDDRRITPFIGAHCNGCQFKAPLGGTMKSGFHECWKAANGWSDDDFTEDTVLDLWNFRGKQKLIDQSVYKISQVQRDDLGDFEEEAGTDGLNRKQRQWLQISGEFGSNDMGAYYFDRALAAHEMASWRFPYHLIDFETSSVALPFYEGMRPYEPVAFQFSHHILEADGRVHHADEFLCVEPGEFPNYQFARALKEAVGQDEGTVFMWSHHENTILNKIIDQLNEDPNRPGDAEELRDFLKRLVKGGDRAMVDLCYLAEKSYFHPDTKGSNSIKKVLPAILKTSKFLRETYSKPIYGAPGGIESKNFSSDQGYTWIEFAADGSAIEPYAKLKQYAKDLLPEGVDEDTSVIAEGGAAATAYARLQFEGLTEVERSRIKSALLRYCELDTLAMVMVLQAWQADCAN